MTIFRDRADHLRFLRGLRETGDRHGWSCVTYCLMPNHVHLLLRTPDGQLAAGMQRLASTYAQRFNRRHGRTGHLFQGRYGSTLVTRESHLLETIRYIALNPVRAGLCRRAADWEWSAHRRLAAGEAGPGLDSAWTYGLFGANAAARYSRFVDDGITP